MKMRSFNIWLGMEKMHNRLVFGVSRTWELMRDTITAKLEFFWFRIIKPIGWYLIGAVGIWIILSEFIM